MVHKVSLLPFPYPYRAILAISNDIDGTPWESFRAVHKVFDDLGIPLADSIFAYQMTGADYNAFSLLEYPSFSPSTHLAAIRKMIKAEKIDSLHALGNYSAVGGVDRKTMVKAVEALLREGISLPIWTNHGDKHNRQNIRIASGDDPASDAYIADLLVPIGVRFLWVGDLSPHVGQARKLTIKDTYRNKRFHPSFIVRSLGHLRYLAKMIFTGKSPLDHSTNDLLFPVTLADNQTFWAFRRFGRWDCAHRNNLGEILSAENLKTLSRKGGYMVAYIHLGIPQGEPGTLFSDQERHALLRLVHYCDRREILVTTTERLLSYHLVHRYLRFRAVRSGGHTVVSIQGIADPVSGDRVPDITDLRGICFLVPDVSRAVIEINGTRADHMILGRRRRLSGYIGIPWESFPDRRKYSYER